MASQITPTLAGRHAGVPAGPAKADGGADLVIIVLNELVGAGFAGGCQATISDYVGAISAASPA